MSQEYHGDILQYRDRLQCSIEFKTIVTSSTWRKYSQRRRVDLFSKVGQEPRMKAHQRKICPGTKDTFLASQNNWSMEQLDSWSCGCTIIGGFHWKIAQPFIQDGIQSHHQEVRLEELQGHFQPYDSMLYIPFAPVIISFRNLILDPG